MMKWLTPIGLFSVAIFTACCQKPLPTPTPGEGYHDGTVEHARAIVTGLLLRDKEKIKTKHILRAKVKYFENNQEKEFDVLMGPYPYTGTITDAVGWFDLAGPRFHVDSSWALVSGALPMVETTMVEGGSGGSTLIAQIDPTSVPTKHRIFLLSKSGKEKATVFLKGNPAINHTWVADKHRYVEHVAGFPNSLSAPAEVPGTGPLRDFIKYVEDRAKEAGVLEAGKIGG